MQDLATKGQEADAKGNIKKLYNVNLPGKSVAKEGPLVDLSRTVQGS